MTESNKGRFKCADDAQAAWAIYADRWANKTSQPARPSEQHDELAHTASIGQPRPRQSIERLDQTPHCQGQTNRLERIRLDRQWPIEPDVDRVAHGLAARVDRLTAIGNGQVSRVAAAAFTILMEDSK